MCISYASLLSTGSDWLNTLLFLPIILFYYSSKFYLSFSLTLPIILSKNPKFIIFNNNCTATLLANRGGGGDQLWGTNISSVDDMITKRLVQLHVYTIIPINTHTLAMNTITCRKSYTVSRKCSAHNYIISQIPTYYSTTKSTYLLFYYASIFCQCQVSLHPWLKRSIGLANSWRRGEYTTMLLSLECFWRVLRWRRR